MKNKLNININLGFLTLLFIALKLTDCIDWSWWWVFCPLWIIPLMIISVALFSMVIFIVVVLIEALIKAYQRRRGW